LLDEMQIHLIPILLGGGVRLFEDLDPEGIELRRTSSIETPGATHLRFSVVKQNTLGWVLSGTGLATIQYARSMSSVQPGLEPQSSLSNKC
jgi:hypothetical protein